MAKRDRAANPRNVHATNALGYGHLGTALYHEESREWTFQRQTTYKPNVIDENLEESQPTFPFIAVTPVSGSDESDDADFSFSGNLESPLNLQPSRARAKPSGLGSTSSIAHVDERFSSSSADSDLGPGRSELLAFGSATRLVEDETRSGRLTIPIAAFGCDPSGHSIKLVELTRSGVSIKHGPLRDASVKVPSTSGGQVATWASGGEQIQQICFSGPSGYEAVWMAVRFISSTVLFRPLVHKRPVHVMRSQQSASDCEDSSSRLDPNPVVVIPSTRTGGHYHADVAFSTFDNSQLAIVDCHGNWSTWKIEGKFARTGHQLFHVTLLHSGKLYSWTSLRCPEEAPRYHDLWHRVRWRRGRGGDTEYLLVANRCDLELVTSTGEKLASIDAQLGPLHKRQWILDIHQSCLKHGDFFVLTSSRVLWLSTSREDWKDERNQPFYSTICSWQHHRSWQDITLRLHVLEVHDGAIAVFCADQTNADIVSIAAFLLVTSQLNEVVNSYRVCTITDHSTFPVAWHEPSLFRIPDLLSPKRPEGFSPPLTMLLRPVQAAIPWRKGTSESPGHLLYMIFGLGRNYNLSSSLFQCTEIDLTYAYSGIPLNAVLLPGRRINRCTKSQYSMSNELDDFIDDDYGSLGSQFPSLVRRVQERRLGGKDGIIPAMRPRLNLADIYEDISRGQPNPSAESRIDLERHLQDIRVKLERETTAKLGPRPLSTLRTPLPYVGDIDEGSSALSTFVNVSNQPDAMYTYSIIDNRTHTGREVMLHKYQDIFSQHLVELQVRIPDRIRANKERLARSIAADLALANIASQPAIPGSPPSDVHLSEPAQPPLTPNIGSLSLSDPAASPPPQLPEPLAPASTPSGTPGPVALARLRRYTHINPGVIPLLSSALNSPHISSLLAHLPASIAAGGDPAMYNWRAVETESAAAADTSGPRARRKAQRAQRRAQQMQARNLADDGARSRDQAPLVGSSQAVPPPARQALSSQAAPPELGTGTSQQQVAMTQPERGVFGARPGGQKDVKGRKKTGRKRVAGF